MRAKLALALLVGLALGVPASAPGKGSTRVVLVSSDGRSAEVRGTEAEIDGLLSRRGSVERIRGGYLRLFFVGPGDFPANPARYYPDPTCVALDWPTYETSCREIDPAVARLLRPPSTLARFRARPTVLARIAYRRNTLKIVALVKNPVELALDRRGRAAPQPPAATRSRAAGEALARLFARADSSSAPAASTPPAASAESGPGSASTSAPRRPLAPPWIHGGRRTRQRA